MAEAAEEVTLPSKEELLKVVEVDNEGDTTAEATHQMSDVEQDAYNQGWRPEAEFKGEGDWIDANEFVARKPLYDSLSKQNKKMKRMETMLKQLADKNREDHFWSAADR